MAYIRLNPGESLTADFARRFGPAVRNGIETKPAGTVVQAFYAVANSAGGAREGLPMNPLIRLRFGAPTLGFLPSPPLKLQKLALSLVVWFPRLIGMERRIRQYIGADAS